MGVVKFPKVEDVITWRDFQDKVIYGSLQLEKETLRKYYYWDKFNKYFLIPIESTVSQYQGEITLDSFRKFKARALLIIRMQKGYDYNASVASKGVQYQRKIKVEFEAFLEKMSVRLKSIDLEKGSNTQDLKRKKTIIISPGAKEIKECMFINFINLEQVEIPRGVTIIRNEAFSGCSRLNKVGIPVTIEEIGDKAFYNCMALSSIQIPVSTKFIGKGAFSGCKNLKNITIKSPRIKLGEDVFSGCSSLNTIVLDITNSANDNEEYLKECLQRFGLQDKVKIHSKEKAYNPEDQIPFTPEAKGDKNQDDMLARATMKISPIPSANTIDTWEQFRLKVIGVKNYADLMQYLKRNGQYKNKVLKKGLVFACERHRVFSFGYTYEKYVQALLKISEKYNGKITISTLVQYMDQTDDINNNYIGNSEVNGGPIKKLKAKVKRQYLAFIADLFDKISNNEEDIITCADKSSYSGRYDIKKIKVKGDVPDFCFNKCANLEEVTLVDAQRLGRAAFQSCSKLRKINLPSSLNSVGDHVFYNCSNLREIDIPCDLKIIPLIAFSGCRALKKVTIGKKVDKIGEKAFMLCISLEEVNVPSNVKIIYSRAFAGCRALKKVTLEEGVEHIKSSAFGECTSLKEIKIPKSVGVNVVQNAFYGCTNLKKIYIHETLFKNAWDFEKCEAKLVPYKDNGMPIELNKQSKSYSDVATNTKDISSPGIKGDSGVKYYWNDKNNHNKPPYPPPPSTIPNPYINGSSANDESGVPPGYIRGDLN